jgi:hypothetical protein
MSLSMTLRLTAHLTPLSEPMIDDYDILDVMSYSQFMSQMSIDPSADTTSTQY